MEQLGSSGASEGSLPGGASFEVVRARRIGANPENSDLVNFRGPD